MHRLLLVCSLLLASSPQALTLHATGGPAARQAAVAAPAATTARLLVTLPSDSSELMVNGTPLPGTGTSRTLETPPLEPDRIYDYTFTAEWKPNTYTTMTRSKTVSITAGSRAEVDLTIATPGDRVRVIYVPTPEDVALEMVRLAGVTNKDVVFEPGCGDARITIAAVRHGAPRGVCVDIQEDRVAESRQRVAEAGFEDRIEVRLGDALEVPDLSQVSVVFLYMGDHFNLLIRPKLWKALPLGARVVSHRFRMGDWEPDRTVFVSSAEGGGDYELHLWTITEAVKR